MWAQVTECASDRERVGASDGATELVESRGAMSCAVGDATKKLQEMMQHSEDGDRRPLLRVKDVVRVRAGTDRDSTRDL
ncbi:unnamed protein product [Symbiodinium sp. KB8]|nr:unnamed protein product [Symbiodinium sp. KB8]